MKPFAITDVIHLVLCNWIIGEVNVEHICQFMGIQLNCYFSSHIDILPTLIALLESNYNLEFAESKHWIGSGLDTSINFNATRFIPLNLNSIEMPNLIMNNQVFYNDRIFTIKENLKVEEQENLKSKDSVKNMYEAYRYINNYVCIDNKISN